MYLLCSGRGAAVPVLMVRAGGLYLRAPSTRGIGASLYLYLRCAPEYSFDRQSFDHIKHFTLWMSINELKTNGLTGKSHRQPILSSRNYGEACFSHFAPVLEPSDHDLSREPLYPRAPSTRGARALPYLAAPSTLGTVKQLVPASEVLWIARSPGAEVSTMCGMVLWSVPCW